LRVLLMISLLFRDNSMCSLYHWHLHLIKSLSLSQIKLMAINALKYMQVCVCVWDVNVCICINDCGLKNWLTFSAHCCTVKCCCCCCCCSGCCCCCCCYCCYCFRLYLLLTLCQLQRQVVSISLLLLLQLFLLLQLLHTFHYTVNSLDGCCTNKQILYA